MRLRNWLQKLIFVLALLTATVCATLLANMPEAESNEGVTMTNVCRHCELRLEKCICGAVVDFFAKNQHLVYPAYGEQKKPKKVVKVPPTFAVDQDWVCYFSKKAGVA